MLESVAERFRSSDLVQFATLFFAALLFVGFVSWPTQPGPNNSYFALSQARLLSLSLLALGYGAQGLSRDRGWQRATLGALGMLALVSSPLEIAGYALSFPEVPLGYSLGLGFLDTVALFGVGLGVAALLRFLRLSLLLPLAVPGLLVGFIVVDIRLGISLSSPVAALGGVAPWHLGLMSVLAAATLGVLARPARRAPRTANEPWPEEPRPEEP